MKRDLWIESFFRPLVIGVMVGCVVWSVVQVVLMFAPSWNFYYLIGGCVLTALEAYYSYRLLQRRRRLGPNVLHFRLVEMVLVLLLLKLGRFVGQSWADVLAEIRGWSHDLSLLFDYETMVGSFLAFLCWEVATETAKDLDRIGDPPQLHPNYVLPLERLSGRFFGGGMVLLIAAGLTRMGDTSELLDLHRPPVRGVALNVLLYFLLGMVMLGQTRFVRLRKKWQQQEVKVAGELARRWVHYSLSLIGLAALLAFVLPTGFTLGFLERVGNYLGVMGAVLFFFLRLILTVLLFPLAWLYWLLLTLLGEQRSPPESQLPTFEPPPPTPSGGGEAGWFEVVQTLIFWAVLLGAVFYVVRSYLRDRPELWGTLTRLRPVHTLRRWWVALWGWLRAWLTGVKRAAAERLPRRLSRRLSRGDSLKAPWRFFRLGALSPRERVRYYYLSILRRAGQQGHPRRRHQTPQEYYSTLEPNLPRSQEEMAALTAAFVEAQYSQHPVEPERERRVRTDWERVKAALRALKRRREVK